MPEKLKNSAFAQQIFPRFSRRRALAARLWKQGKSLLALREKLRALSRRHGFVAALEQLLWESRQRRIAAEDPRTLSVPPGKMLRQILAEACPPGLPLVSVVVPLYAKREEVPFFLRALFRQDYPGDIELLLVDDCCPQGSLAAAQEAFASQNPRALSAITLKALRTGKNTGNCGARNMGVEAASGDIVVILDADCLMNASFISLHVLHMVAGNYDALFGPCNLETGHRLPLDALKEYERFPERVLAEQKMQDPLCPGGFVNCITRNFSFRKAAAPLPLFDERFAYTADPASGFGWEDVDAGRKLYDAGLRLGYAEGTFTVHVSHENNATPGDKAARSLRNFVKLLEKYPDMPEISGRWCRDTYKAILGLYGTSPVSDAMERNEAERLLFRTEERRPPAARPSKRLRILSFQWHTPHQYELFKLPHDFFLLKGVGESFVQNWNGERRPKPDNARFINCAKLDMRDYDLAIVPFDENVLAPQNCNGTLGPEWGAAFRWFLENVPLPKIGLCHGTPQFYGQYDITYDKPDLLRVNEAERLRLVAATKDFPVVCNSHQAEKEWGFARSQVIWQGFDPMEFPLRKKSSFGCLSLGAESMRSRPFYNGFFIYQETSAGLPEAFTPKPIKTPSPKGGLLQGNCYARTKFRNYVDVLRDNSVYFNPTLRSPMPRTRGEAMLCGLVPVSLPNHDAGMFIRNGKNGFIGKEPQELREYITFCLENPEAAWKIGLEARKTACTLFALDRYLAEWQALLHAMT